MATKRIDNISFEVEFFKDYTFEQFNNEFRGKFQGYDIRTAFKELTGRDPEIIAIESEVKSGKIKRTAKAAGEIRPERDT